MSQYASLPHLSKPRGASTPDSCLPTLCRHRRRPFRAVTNPVSAHHAHKRKKNRGTVSNKMQISLDLSLSVKASHSSLPLVVRRLALQLRTSASYMSG